MKRILVIGAIAAALMAFGAATASAQRIDNSGNLIYSHGQLLDEDGHVLTEYELMDIIGRRTFNETYNGARQQYKAGKGLIIGGAVAMGVGVATSVGSAIYLGPDRVRSIINGFERDTFENEQARIKYKGETTLGAAAFLSGWALASLGNVCLAVGTPLFIIGKSRLNWIADDHNEEVYRHGRRPYIDFNTENGPGIRLNF